MRKYGIKFLDFCTVCTKYFTAGLMYNDFAYRVQVKMNVGSVTIGTNFITVNVDGCSGMPGISGVC